MAEAVQFDAYGGVEELGDGTDAWAIGDEVLGWTDERRSHAELAAIPADQLVAKPASVSWEAAGALFVAEMAAVGSMRAVAPQDGEVVVVSAAAGGVGSFAVQLARLTGATVIGLASERNHAWLQERGVIAVAHGDGAKDRINTIIDFAAVEEHGVSAQGTSQTASAAALAELVGHVAAKEVEVPIAATSPLRQVREAYTRLADRATHGKIVLLP